MSAAFGALALRDASSPVGDGLDRSLQVEFSHLCRIPIEPNIKFESS